MLLAPLRRLLDRRRDIPGAADSPPAADIASPEAAHIAPPPAADIAPPAQRYQGYLDELSTTHASGWLWEMGQDGARADFQIVLHTGEIVADGVASWPRPDLAGVGDGRHGFYARFGRTLTALERDQAALRVSGDGQILPRAPALRADGPAQGYLEELSAVHAHGWAWMRGWPDERVAFEIVLGATGEIIAQGIANEFKHGLSGIGIGDGAHGFWVRFARPLDATEQAAAIVRIAGQALPRAPNLLAAYEPVLHVAMDIVDNCNLRCPFCLYDYEGVRTTHFMSDETLTSALGFLPYVRDGEFWFSCLHEPTLHPSLAAYVDRVPRDLRRKLFFTTNLAKRMDESYFAWLAGNGMHHINVSIESRDPAIYERMRKGARWRIFAENWDRLIAALDASAAPTPIRYIAMAYKSNLHELPGLVRHLLEERRAWQVELRYTFDVVHLPPAFRAAEFLDEAEWTWLAAELAGFPAERVQLHRPPVTAEASEPAAPAPPGRLLPGRLMLRLSWDGSLKAVGVQAASRYDAVLEQTIFDGNIREITDPARFLGELAAG